MLTVEEPTSPEEIENLKDRRMVDEGSRCGGWHVVEWDNPKPNDGGTDLRPTTQLLGMEIHRDHPKHSLSLSQSQFITNLLQEHGL